MTEPSRPSKEDIELFRNTVGPVQPLTQDKVRSMQRKPAPIPVQSQNIAQRALDDMATGTMAPMDLDTGKELLYRRPGIQNKVWQKLRRGQIRIEAELDLHGMTVASAKDALLVFLATSRSGKQRCVRIVHGKGRGSIEGKPVLKNSLNHWLPQRREVLAYCSARPADGGTGAVYVLIKGQK
ncbi:MAG: Smr/MutS family protein [Gammaproteobacteria bacterium]